MIDKKKANKKHSSVTRPSLIDQSSTLINAVKYHQAGKLKEADSLYAKILNSDPTNFDALHLSGLSAYQSKKFVKAECFFKTALSFTNNIASVHFNFGLLLNDLQRFDEAIISLDKAILIQTEYPEAFFSPGGSV